MSFLVDRVATIQRRPLSETELSDAACTPKWLCDMLHEVDVDPCSNPRSQVKSRWAFSLEKGLDGLKLPWRKSATESASVYENFTYSTPMPWCEKTIHELRVGHAHEVIVLCKLDTSTKWWKVLTSFDPDANDGDPLQFAPDIWMFDERIQFDEHPELIAMRLEKRIAKWEKDGKKGKRPTDGTSSNNFCSVIVHHRGYPWVDGKPVSEVAFTSPLRTPPLKLHSVATLWRRGV